MKNHEMVDLQTNVESRDLVAHVFSIRLYHTDKIHKEKTEK
jgi:hypothetical protein